MFLRTFGVWPLSLLLVLLLGCGDINIDVGSVDDDLVEVREESFAVGPSPKLEVKTFNGPISVVSGPDGNVLVRAALKKADRINYEVSQVGGTVRVVAEQEGTTIGQSPEAEIQVIVPSEIAVVLRTSNGRIVVEGTTGGIDAETSNGRIEVNGFRGSANLETSNGSIDFSGEFISGSQNEMRTSNGSVTVQLLGEASVMLDASSSRGRVTSELPIVATSTGDNHLFGSIGGGEAELIIRTSNGSVLLK